LADWIVCPHCRLKHARRATGACPRCRESVGPAASPAPDAGVADASGRHALPEVFDEAAFARAVAARAADAAPPVRSLSSAERVAGAILLANGVLQLASRTLESSAPGAVSLVSPWVAGFDVVVGGVLLSGQPQVRRWTIVRLGAGLLLLCALHMALGRWFSALLQMVFCASLLWLLLRGAQVSFANVTAVLGASTAALIAILEVAPFFGLTNPFGALAGVWNGETARQSANEITGEHIGFSVTLPDPRWHVALREEGAGLREESGVRQETSAVVRRPDILADLRVFALELPAEAVVDDAAVIDTLVEHERDQIPGLLVVEDSWLDTARGRTRVLEGTARVGGGRVGVALGFAMRGRCGFLMAGSAPQRVFHHVRDDLLQTFGSLDAPGCVS
jgi:hypothetical protein